MPAEEMRRKGALGELGFPLLDPARLGGPVSDLRLESVKVDSHDDGGWATATNGRVRVRFPLRQDPGGPRGGHKLSFAVGPVEIE